MAAKYQIRLHHHRYTSVESKGSVGPSNGGLGMAKIFDMINAIYGKDFIRYE